MTGVDLPFDEKRGYERLHQIALASLLRHTDLFSRPGYSDIEGDIAWEPEGGLFDLAGRRHHRQTDGTPPPRREVDRTTGRLH